MKLSQILSASVALIALAACAPDFNPPPDYKGGYLMDTDRSRTVTVEPGDTLYVISRRYDVPTKVIADRNGLVPPYGLSVGQSLILDPTRTHVAASGETLTSIARQYGVDEATLAAANEFPMGTQLRPGTEVWIPDPFTSAAGPSLQSGARNYASANAGVTANDLPPVTAAPRNTRPITSENLPPLPGAASLSNSAAGVGASAGSSAGGSGAVGSGALGAGAGAIAAAPLGQSAPQPFAPVVPQPVTPSTEVMTPAPVFAPPVSAPQPLTPQLAAPPETNVASLPPANLPAEHGLPLPASTSGVRFTWPLSGPILARFGAAGKGLHNDGINIGAPAGTQVRAAGNGVVAYAGNELKGFGNLLLIKHADGWTTAYAHNDKLLVAKGDTVAQGQVIAVVGRTGNVDKPQLHFEVRKGTQALDPMAYLAK